MLIRPLDSAPPSSATAAGGVAVAADGRGNDTAAAAATAPTRADVKAAVETVNAALAAMNRSLEFSIDPDTHAVIVRLIDTQDNQVLRQVPSREMLAIAKAIDQWQGLLLRQRA